MSYASYSIEYSLNFSFHKNFSEYECKEKIHIFTTNSFTHLKLNCTLDFFKFSKISILFRNKKIKVKIFQENNLINIHPDGYKKPVSEDQKNSKRHFFSPGKYSLIFQFSSSIPTAIPSSEEKQKRGIFNFKKHNNKTLLTLFEPRFARTSFPCFDSPSKRAKFSISLKVDNCNKDTIALSNMNIVKSENGSCWVFERSPKLPTYVMCFTIGKYHIHSKAVIKSIVNKNKTINVRLFSLEKSESKSCEVLIKSLFLKIVKYSIEFLENFFNIEFTAEKFDVVIVPFLYDLGGMENHGCVFLSRKVCEKKESFVSYLCHEITHHYLGNYVGLKFWIKEGLCQYFENVIGSNFVDLKKMKYKENTKVTQSLKGKFLSVTYGQSLNLILGIIKRVGKKAFKEKLRGLLCKNEEDYVSEKQFLKTFE